MFVSTLLKMRGRRLQVAHASRLVVFGLALLILVIWGSQQRDGAATHLVRWTARDHFIEIEAHPVLESIARSERINKEWSAASIPDTGGYFMATQYVDLLCNSAGFHDNTLTEAMLHLRPHWVNAPLLRSALRVPDGHTYFVAMLLHESHLVIPTLLGELLKLLFILQQGPGDFGNVFVSIYESGSKDFSAIMLRAFEDNLQSLGVPHRVVTGGIKRRRGQQRINFLAQARNWALEPMLTEDTHKWDHLIYINDVVVCASSLAELVAERFFNEAELACAMDYLLADEEMVIFYDIWVTIDMDGKHFSNAPPFVTEQSASAAYRRNMPFQVFSCWGGAVAMSASLIQRDGLRFRMGYPLECSSSECEILCRDMWSIGRGRIITVPNVVTAYNVPHHRAVIEKNLFQSLTRKRVRDPVQFIEEPPDLIECCALDTPFEDGVDFSSCTPLPWKWWYEMFDTPKAIIQTDVSPSLVAVDNAAEMTLAALSRLSIGDRVCDTLPKRNIPRQIVFSWLSSEVVRLPTLLLQHVMLWAYRHPCYAITILTPESSEKLVRKHFEEFVDDFQSLRRRPGELANVQQYVHMYEHGGIFAHTDTIPLRSLESLLLPEDTFVIGLDNDLTDMSAADKFVYARQQGVTAHCFAVSPKNPILRAVIERVFRNGGNRAAFVYPLMRSRTMGEAHLLADMLSTGPGPLSEVVLDGGEVELPKPRILGLRVLSGGLDGEIVLYTTSRATQEDIFVQHLDYGYWLDVGGAGVMRNNMHHTDFLEVGVPLQSDGFIFGPCRPSAIEGYYAVWNSSKYRGRLAGEPTFLWLRGRNHMPTASTKGCLELRTGPGPDFLEAGTSGLIWRVCWPAEEELDMVYMILSERGALTVYSAANNCCGVLERTPPRKVLWTSDTARIAERSRDAVDSISGKYRLAVAASNQVVILREDSDVELLFTYMPSTTATCPKDSLIGTAMVEGEFSAIEAMRICLNTAGCSSVTYSSHGKSRKMILCSVSPAPEPTHWALSFGLLSFWPQDAYVFRDTQREFDRQAQRRGTCPEDKKLREFSATLEDAEIACSSSPQCRSVEYATADASEARNYAWLCSTVNVPDYDSPGWIVSVKRHVPEYDESISNPEIVKMSGSPMENLARCKLENHDRELCQTLMPARDRQVMRARCACTLEPAFDSQKIYSFDN